MGARDQKDLLGNGNRLCGWVSVICTPLSQSLLWKTVLGALDPDDTVYAVVEFDI